MTLASALIERMKPDLVTDEEAKNKMNRLVCAEFLRTIFNLSYGKGHPDFQDHLDDETLIQLQRTFSSILAMGTPEDPFGDRAAEAAFEAEAAAILAVADKPESNNEEREMQLVEDPEIAADIKTRLEEGKKLAEERKSREEKKNRKITKEDEREWDDALKRVEKGKSKKGAKAPEQEKQQPRPLDDLHALKTHIVNLLIVPGAAKLLPKGWDVQAMHGLCQVLDVQAKIDPRNPSDHLMPILTVLIKACKASSDARAHVKRYIFKQDAEKETSLAPQNSKNMEPPPYVNLRTMKTDQGEWDLRSILTKHVCSFNMGLKQCTSELIFICCSEDSSEYIRLCGFGSAAGLLADKGLPGFEKLSERAVSLDELAAEARKRKKGGGS